MRKPISNLFLLMLSCYFSYGQMQHFAYKRELKGVSEQWHRIILPDEVFGKVSQDLTDIRIFGITAGNDTVEVPYLLRLASNQTVAKEVAFKKINTAQNGKGFYFTFEIPTTEPINHINIGFKQQNFDWRVKLEGSQNQSEWFTILQNYRILSIKDGATDFQFTKLTFPSSKYRYFRLFINSKEKPELTSASIAQQEITKGIVRDYPIKKFSKKENKQTKQTEIDIELYMPVPVSYLKMVVTDSVDYYRPMTIKYLTDSTQTEHGWQYRYHTLSSATLTSVEKNECMFNTTTTQQLKIYIDNHDNQPLTIDTVSVKGFEYEFLARFTEQASYFLVYGNNEATKPNYDIARFSDKVPSTLQTLDLGNELRLEKEKVSETVPLFINKTWLWAIISLTVLVMGGFTIKMMRKA